MSGAPAMHARSARELLAGYAQAPDLAVTGVVADSRQVRGGELFLACAGHGRHGADFVNDAVARGAALVAFEPGPPLPSLQVPVVAVPGLGRYAGEIAARWYGHPSERLHVIGVTGTDGKTSVAWLAAQALDRLAGPAGYVGTLGAGPVAAPQPTGLTTPAAVDLQRILANLATGGARAVAMEVSSIALDQARVAGVRFDAAVLTNIGRDHLDYHGSHAAYVAAKRALFDNPEIPVLLLNRDDRWGRAWAHELSADREVICYGIGGEPEDGPHVLAAACEAGPEGLSISIRSSWGNALLRSPLIGRFNVANLLAALGALLARGERLRDAVEALAQVPPVPGRMQAFVRSDGALAVVDYAHTPQALANALQACRVHARGRVLCVFGCGGDRDRGKRPEMGRVAAAGADHLIVTSDNPRSEDPRAIIDEILAGVAGTAASVEAVVDRREAIARALALAGPGDLVLIAGKGHETTQTIGDQVLPFSDIAVVRELMEGAR